MTNTVLMMGNSQEHANLAGDPVKADGWYGHTDGLHTVVVQVVNFTGRIYIEASLELDPGATDWFPIELTKGQSWIEFPLISQKPTGDYESGGDTKTVGFTFKINALWLRARLDRDYLNTLLYDNDSQALADLGNVKKITLAR